MTRHFTKENFFLAVGSLGFAHEVVITEGERPMLLAACLAFAGLKWALPADAKRRSKDET